MTRFEVAGSSGETNEWTGTKPAENGRGRRDGTLPKDHGKDISEKGPRVVGPGAAAIRQSVSASRDQEEKAMTHQVPPILP